MRKEPYCTHKRSVYCPRKRVLLKLLLRPVLQKGAFEVSGSNIEDGWKTLFQDLQAKLAERLKADKSFCARPAGETPLLSPFPLESRAFFAYLSAANVPVGLF